MVLMLHRKDFCEGFNVIQVGAQKALEMLAEEDFE